MAQCFDGEVTPLVTPFERRNQACLDIGCGIIAVTQVIPANGGEEFYEDCSGEVVTGTVVRCPEKVLVMNSESTLESTQLSILNELELIKDTSTTNQLNMIAAINAASRGYAYDAALGNVAGVTPITISGYGATNSAYGGVVADLQAGNYTYAFPTAATAMTISSTSASDTALGSGAQTASITYIDFTTGAEVTVIVALNGQTPVGFTLNGFRANDAFCATYIINNANLGDIYIGSGTVTAGIPAVVYGKIRAKALRLSQAVYTVPAGKTLDLVSVAGCITAANTICHFQLRSRLTAQPAPLPVLSFSQVGNFSLTGSISPLSFPAGTDIYFVAQCSSGGASAAVTCQCYLR